MGQRVLAATTDLFLQSRITEVARSLGFKEVFVGDVEELRKTLKEGESALAVLDLSSNEYDPFQVARVLKESYPSLRILGFYPHVRTELKASAENSGIDYVVPNSSFTASLKNVLSGMKATG